MPLTLDDVERTHGRRFSVARKEARGRPWQTVGRALSLTEAVRRAADVEGAYEACVFTSEGLVYWNSRFPEVFGSSVLEQ